MKKYVYLILSLLLVFVFASSCVDCKLSSLSATPVSPQDVPVGQTLSQPGTISPDVMPNVTPTQPDNLDSNGSGLMGISPDGIITKLDKKYSNLVPKEWGLKVTGLKTRLDTTDKVIALTFDACGGKGGCDYDKTLIDYLIRENIPATLFINSQWIDENMDVFLSLSKNNLFEIENHGVEHRPLSVTGQTAYGITGTKGVPGIINEVLPNADKIYRLTGRYPLFFRSGTDFYDDIAVQVVSDLGEQAIGYSVLGDAGATFTKSEIKKACLSAKPGAIIICHMNHPEKETAEGIMEAVPALKADGYKLVKLEEYPLK